MSTDRQTTPTIAVACAKLLSQLGREEGDARTATLVANLNLIMRVLEAQSVLPDGRGFYLVQDCDLSIGKPAL